MKFTCNICSSPCEAETAEFTREAETCRQCGSSVRYRSIIHNLSIALFGKPLLLSDFPVEPGIRGIGTSDWPRFANLLPHKVHYTNTFFDGEPHVDLKNPPPDLIGQCDFVICSEVLEHVLPPVQPAFDGIHALLKPGGVAIITVPYQYGFHTIEHFPNLHKFAVTDIDDKPVLVNKTAAGAYEVFDNLSYHGGRGSTLEMRIFGDKDLPDNFKAAGFETVQIVNEPYEPFGIVFLVPWSLPMVAFKRGSRESLSRERQLSGSAVPGT